MPSLLITDTSVLLNIFASGHAESILQGAGWNFVVCPPVVKEAQFLRNKLTGEVELLNLERSISAGLLSMAEPETDEEFEYLVDFSAAMGRGGDGEAMCFALAQARGWPVAIDDERAIKRSRRVGSKLQFVSTPEVLREWAGRRHIDRNQLAVAIRRVDVWASYFPPISHSLSDWWQSQLNG